MRRMFDGINPAGIPSTAQIVAGYVDGHWPSLAGLRARFPNARALSIAVDPAHDAEILDCETGDATPADCPGWVQRQRARGIEPTVYCGLAAWPQVRAAFTAARVPEPCWWVADYNMDGATLPAGAHALQFNNQPGYDESVVADYWPTLDGEADMTPAESQQLADVHATVAKLEARIGELDETHYIVAQISAAVTALQTAVAGLKTAQAAGGVDPAALAQAIAAHVTLTAK